MPLKNRSAKKHYYSILLFFTTFLIIFFGGKSFRVYALPAYCNYSSTTHQCCRSAGAPYGPQILNCTFPEPSADLFCGHNGTIVAWGIACPY